MDTPDISGIETMQVDFLTYYLPATPAEVGALLTYAQQQGSKIAVRGAAHSFPLVAQQEAEGNCLFVTLAKMAAVTLDQATGRVTVQAGCHLGYDPYDPTGLSTTANSLLDQLDPLTPEGRHQNGAKGWALPDLGGISHQTVGGFMATGSSGGSITYSFESAIQSVTAMTYAGGVQTTTYNRPQPENADDPFYAVAFAHRGLLGIITEVVFQCEPTFDIVGKEVVSSLYPTNQSAIDLFGDSQPGPDAAKRPTIAEFFRGQASGGADYSRLIWWPQPGLGRMVAWQANRASVEAEAPGFPVPYKEVPYFLGSPLISTLGADALLTVMGRWQTWLGDLLGTNNPQYEKLLLVGQQQLQPWLMRFMLDEFVQLPTPEHDFSQAWSQGLPMDNQMSDKLFPVWFTELWIPLDKAEDVMRTMNEFYSDASHPERAGTFCCELYAARQSPFWMSPAYGCDVIRLDLFWFAGNLDGTPQNYYRQFWQLLAPYNFRPHWGKYMPLPADLPDYPNYLPERYPRWNDVMALRQQLDPHNLFLTNYWQQYLSVKD
jgi:hypothetical protein